ncbi:unnamed protein product [Schistosoma guineensis]|nr:unnamed protein product [Schistosoma guineensis]
MVDVILLDPSKAFDKEFCLGLQPELESSGIRYEIRGWISDFTDDRRQEVPYFGFLLLSSESFPGFCSLLLTS